MCSQEKKENPHKVPGALAPQPRPLRKKDANEDAQGSQLDASKLSRQEQQKQQQQQQQEQQPSPVQERRGFIVAHHPQYGYLLLLAEKKKKGRHYQLPGGHVDAADGSPYASPEDACKVGAVRELFEETGIDLRPQLGLERVKHCPINGLQDLKGRWFYSVELRNTDSVPGGELSTGVGGTGQPIIFKLRLSDEHNGFCFEPDVNKAAQMIEAHSGGHNKTALLAMALAGMKTRAGEGTAGRSSTARLSKHSRASNASDYF